MNKFLLGFAVAIPMALTGCATIVEGTSQTIHMTVVPSSANCYAFRSDQIVGSFDRQTETLNVDKSRHDMEIRCVAPGYKEKRVVLVSSASGWGIAGALTLDFGLTDWMTGALNKYDSTVNIVMEHE